MRVAKILLLLVAAVLVAGVAAQAREGYIVRFAGASVNPTGDLRIDESDAIPLGDGTTLEERDAGQRRGRQRLRFLHRPRASVQRPLRPRLHRHAGRPRHRHLTGSATVRIRDDATNTVLFEATEALTMPLGSVDMTADPARSQLPLRGQREGRSVRRPVRRPDRLRRPDIRGRAAGLQGRVRLRRHAGPRRSLRSGPGGVLGLGPLHGRRRRDRRGRVRHAGPRSAGCSVRPRVSVLS